MGFLKACVLSTLLLLNMATWARAAARPTPDASTTKLDSTTWDEMLVDQPTRIGSTVSHDNDYKSLQSLLTKNIPGTPEEKGRVVDLLLQLLGELDLPTLCEVIANDTDRRTKNSSRDVKTFERSTEAPEITYPPMKPKQRNVDAIPYFNILGQSRNAIQDKETEQSPTASRGLSHESITRYHRNMVERVNRGMDAMREYGNKRRAAYFNGIRRNKNGIREQFNANVPANTRSQVDEVNELKNLHAEERSTDSMPVSWERNSVENIGVEGVETNTSDATVTPTTEGGLLNRALGSDEGFTSKNIWIQSLNVERPNSELYSQSFLNRVDENSNVLVRNKRIDEDDSKNGEDTFEDTLGDRSRRNLLKQLSWAEDKLSRDTDSQYGIMGKKLYPQVRTTVKSGIIFDGSDIYNTNNINDEYVNRNLDKYNVLNSVNGVPSAEQRLPTEETIAENNFVNMDTSKNYEESNDINFQSQTATNEINFTRNTISNLQGESNVEENRNLTGSDRNTTFELGRRSDSSIDDFFGASSSAGRSVNLPENNNLLKSSPMSSSVTSEQVNATDKITYDGGNYLTDVLSGVSKANIDETQATSSTETLPDDSTNKPNFRGDKMRTLPVGHESVNTASSSDNLTGPVWIRSTTSHNKEGNVTLSEISNNTNYVPSQKANEDSTGNAKTLSTVDDNFVTHVRQGDNKTNAGQERYTDSFSVVNLKRDFQHKNKTAFSFIRELDNNASSLSLSSRTVLTNLVKPDNNITARAANESESVDRVQKYNDTVSSTVTPSFENGEDYAKSNTSASKQNVSLVKSAGLNARNTDASSVLDASISTTPGNSSGINATAADTQEYHISRGAVTFNNHVEVNSTEPNVRYEPAATGQEQKEPSLHMFGPYGEGESKVKDDAIVSDVVNATPQMSIEFAKADLEMELKKLSRDVSTLDKDFISIMRGNQRGVQRGVSSTAFQNFLSQPVMKSLKRIHEFRQQRGNSQNVTDDAAESRAGGDIGSLIGASLRNITHNESSTSETPVSPGYNITHLGLENLRQNVKMFTNQSKKDSYTDPANDQVGNADGSQYLFNNSLPYPTNVTRMVSNKDQINETSTATNASGFNNFLTEKKATNTLKSTINKVFSDNSNMNEYVSEMSNNFTLLNMFSRNTSRDTERERRQPTESNNMTAQSQSLNTATRIPQQEINSSDSKNSNNFITDDIANMSSTDENTLYSNSASTNQTLVTFGSETLPFTNSSEIMNENSTSEMRDEQTDSYFVSGNATAAQIPDVDGNTTDSDSVSNNTQTSGDFLRYFLTMPTAKTGDDARKSPRSFYDILQNTVDAPDEETEEQQLWRKSYGSDFSKYLNSKRQFKDVQTLQDYQNELMKDNEEDMIRQNLLHYPNMKLSMKPESSLFLAQDFYKDASRSPKSQQVARVNPWKAFNIELGKEKVKQQKEALHRFHYPSFKIRHHDDVIIPSVKDYLWNARPWPNHDKILPSRNGKYRSGFSKMNEYMREKQRDMDFSPLLSEHTKLWGNRFSQGYYGRVLDEQPRAPIMSSYLGFPGQLASLKTVDASARNFIGFKAADQSTISLPQHTDLQKDTAEKSMPTLVSTIPLKAITENIDNKVKPSFSLPKESDGSSLTRRSDINLDAVQNPIPGYSMIPPGPTGVPAAEDFKCPGLFGYYTDPENCSSFFVCSWGASYRLQCSEGTLWNSADSVCDWAANVNCDQRKSP